MAEKKVKFEFDDKLKEEARKVGEEVKEHGGELKKDITDIGGEVNRRSMDEWQITRRSIGLLVAPFPIVLGDRRSDLEITISIKCTKKLGHP